VLGECLAEIGGQNLLLACRLHVIDRADQDERDDGSPFAHGEHRAGYGQKDAAIDGMAEVAVRAGLNQLVIDFEDNLVAPVSTEMPARPNRHGHTGCGEGHTEPGDRGIQRREPLPERANAQPIRAQQNKHGRPEEQQAKQARAPVFIDGDRLCAE